MAKHNKKIRGNKMVPHGDNIPSIAEKKVDLTKISIEVPEDWIPDLKTLQNRLAFEDFGALFRYAVRIHYSEDLMHLNSTPEKDQKENCVIKGSISQIQDNMLVNLALNFKIREKKLCLVNQDQLITLIGHLLKEKGFEFNTEEGLNADIEDEKLAKEMENEPRTFVFQPNQEQFKRMNAVSTLTKVSLENLFVRLTNVWLNLDMDEFRDQLLYQLYETFFVFNPNPKQLKLMEHISELYKISLEDVFAKVTSFLDMDVKDFREGLVNFL